MKTVTRNKIKEILGDDSIELDELTTRISDNYRYFKSKILEEINANGISDDIKMIRSVLLNRCPRALYWLKNDKIILGSDKTFFKECLAHGEDEYANIVLKQEEFTLTDEEMLKLIIDGEMNEIYLVDRLSRSAYIEYAIYLIKNNKTSFNVKLDKFKDLHEDLSKLVIENQSEEYYKESWFKNSVNGLMFLEQPRINFYKNNIGLKTATQGRKRFVFCAYKRFNADRTAHVSELLQKIARKIGHPADKISRFTP